MNNMNYKIEDRVQLCNMPIYLKRFDSLVGIIKKIDSEGLLKIIFEECSQINKNHRLKNQSYIYVKKNQIKLYKYIEQAVP